MPRDPQGRKRPADVIGNAVHVMRIATGQIDEPPPKRQAKAGKVGGPARANKLSPKRRKEIAKMGASKRWKNS